MLESLKFCAGAVASKDYVPALTHFVIEYGRVRSFNGVLALCSPIDFDIACKPKATTMIKAVQMAEETIQLAMTPAGRLSIKSGKFKALVDCIPEDNTPHPFPEGAIIHFDGEQLLAGLIKVAPFIGNDASRRWANGVLVKNGSLFATNNVTLVQYWIGLQLEKEINIPGEAVKEILRIGEAPSHAQLADGNITFHFSGDRWLRTQLYSTAEWPNLEAILDRESAQSPIQEELFKGLEVLKPFVDKSGAIFFEEGRITTHLDESEGASYEVPGLDVEGKYHIDMLKLLKDTAATIDWSSYPKPAMFRNERLRGAIVGIKK